MTTISCMIIIFIVISGLLWIGYVPARSCVLPVIRKSKYLEDLDSIALSPDCPEKIEVFFHELSELKADVWHTQWVMNPAKGEPVCYYSGIPVYIKWAG